MYSDINFIDFNVFNHLNCNNDFEREINPINLENSFNYKSNTTKINSSIKTIIKADFILLNKKLKREKSNDFINKNPPTSHLFKRRKTNTAKKPKGRKGNYSKTSK